jgi:hypothetical protein
VDTPTCGVEALTSGVETLTSGVETLTPGSVTPTLGTVTPTLGTVTPTLGSDTPGSEMPAGCAPEEGAPGRERSMLGSEMPRPCAFATAALESEVAMQMSDVLAAIRARLRQRHLGTALRARSAVTWITVLRLPLVRSCADL